MTGEGKSVCHCARVRVNGEMGIACLALFGNMYNIPRNFHSVMAIHLTYSLHTSHVSQTLLPWRPRAVRVFFVNERS